MKNFYQWIQLREVGNPRVDILTSPSGEVKYIRNKKKLHELLDEAEKYLENIKNMSGLENYNHRNQIITSNIWSKISMKTLMTDIRSLLRYRNPINKLPNWRFGNEKLVPDSASYIDQLETILEECKNYFKTIYEIFKKHENEEPIKNDVYHYENSVKNILDNKNNDDYYSRATNSIEELAYEIRHYEALLEHINNIMKNAPAVEIEPKHYERFWKPYPKAQ